MPHGNSIMNWIVVGASGPINLFQQHSFAVEVCVYRRLCYIGGELMMPNENAAAVVLSASNITNSYADRAVLRGVCWPYATANASR